MREGAFSLPESIYNRDAALQYAHTWANGRNPAYFDFTNLGGDCTSFTSQCVYAGAGVMNYTPTFGWYYSNSNNRSPSWSGVQFFYNFITANRGAGPYAAEAQIHEILPGDFLQLGHANGVFYHSPFIVYVGYPAAPENILLAAHTYDADWRPLSTYQYDMVRFMHILGVRS
jgi:hypothetical protein